MIVRKVKRWWWKLTGRCPHCGQSFDTWCSPCYIERVKVKIKPRVYPLLDSSKVND